MIGVSLFLGGLVLVYFWSILVFYGVFYVYSLSWFRSFWWFCVFSGPTFWMVFLGVFLMVWTTRSFCSGLCMAVFSCHFLEGCRFRSSFVLRYPVFWSIFSDFGLFCCFVKYKVWVCFMARFRVLSILSYFVSF